MHKSNIRLDKKGNLVYIDCFVENIYLWFLSNFNFNL